MNSRDLPKFALGTWSMGGGSSWGPSNDSESKRTLLKALDLGVKWIDTAPAYGNGLSERLIGEVLSKRRHEFMLSTKVGLTWEEKGGSVHIARDGVTVYRNLTPSSIRRQLEGSLKRLKTDYIDVLITHHQNEHDTLEETIETLDALKREGKILSYGASNVGLDKFKKYLELSNLVMIQEKWSPLDDKNGELGNYARDHGVFFQAYSPLERGLLTGNVTPSDEVVGRARESNPWFREEKIRCINNALFPLLEIAESYHTALSAVMLRWMMDRYKLFGVCVGARKEWQIKESAKALEIDLSEDEEAMISLALTSILSPQ